MLFYIWWLNILPFCVIIVSNEKQPICTKQHRLKSTLLETGGKNMHSIRTKIMLMTVCTMLIVVTVATISGLLAIRKIGNESANQTLFLLCESGEKNLDSYLESIEKSVDMVSTYINTDLDGIDDTHLDAHLNRTKSIFDSVANKTNGAITYYYRIDPVVSSNVKGFWFVNLDGNVFVEHDVTEIPIEDTDDGTLLWFRIPKRTGKDVWLPPYLTDSLNNVRVFSYNMPIFYAGNFVGVIGIEIDYSIIKRHVDNITLYENGYAFINDKDGNVIYHPRMDITSMAEQPKVPEGILGKDGFVRYKYNGVEKQAVWLELVNGMRLNVSVPVAEINALWINWSLAIVITFVIIMVLFVLILLHFTGHITRPLRNLAEMAEQVDAGNFNCQMEYKENDEVGVLTKTFNKLTRHLKAQISDLNDLAYADALTLLHNKGAFDICVKKIQKRIDNNKDRPPKIAICIFDCNYLKKINDQYGHEKGDIYLKESAAAICEVFKKSIIFRIGGDEFAAILTNDDYRNRDILVKSFGALCEERRLKATESWKRIEVACGLAVYNHNEDLSVNDVIRRADKIMYKNKYLMKTKRAQNNNTP